MAYADSIRTAIATMNDVATLLEGLMVSYQQSSTNSIINTTSTSATAYTSATVTVTVASGEIVLLMGKINASNSTSANTVTMDLYEDGTIITAGFGGNAYMARGNTNGADAVLSTFVVRAPAAGSHTYIIKWYTNANTAYSGGHVLTAILLQNS